MKHIEFILQAATRRWYYSDICLQRNRKGPNFFRCRQVTFRTRAWNFDHRDYKSFRL